jgi:hypothetical protein
MAITPYDQEIQRRNASIHIQVKLLNVPTNIAAPYTKVSLTGEIARIFRGPSTLHIGDLIHFRLNVMSDNADFKDFPLGGSFVSYIDLCQMQFIELYSNGEPPICNPISNSYMLIEKPTDDPVIAQLNEQSWQEILEFERKQDQRRFKEGIIMILICLPIAAIVVFLIIYIVG